MSASGGKNFHSCEQIYFMSSYYPLFAYRSTYSSNGSLLKYIAFYLDKILD